MVEDIVRSAVLQSLRNDRELEDGPQADSPNDCEIAQTGNVNEPEAKHTSVPSSSSKDLENGSDAQNITLKGKPKRKRGPAPDANWINLRAKIGAVGKKHHGSGELTKRNQKMRQNVKTKMRHGEESGHLNADKHSSDAGNFSAFMPRAVRVDANPTNIVALDCEMVGVGPDGRTDALARVSVVNYAGDVLYDAFVKPGEAVVDYRTRWSGVRAEDISDDSTAVDLYKAQETVGGLLKGRIVVGHAIKNDFRVLKIAHPWHQIRDTSEFYKRLWKRHRRNRPALRMLVAQVLGVDTFQNSEHDSCEDARAALALYKKNAKEWEKLIRDRRFNKSKLRPKKESE